LDARHDRDHFDGSFGGAAAGVAVRAADAGDGLFFGVGREDSEDNGDHLIARNLSDTAGALAGDEVEMGSFAAHDRAEANDGGVFLRAAHGFGGKGDLECAGDALDGYLSLGDSNLLQPQQAAAEELLNNRRIEPGGDDADPRSSRKWFVREARSSGAHGVEFKLETGPWVAYALFMRATLSQRLLAVLQLTRLALVFTAIADSFAMYILRARWLAKMNAGTTLEDYLDYPRMIAIAAISVGLYAFGMSLNDIIDHRRDQQIASHRPIPSGRIGMLMAHVTSTGFGLIAVVAGVAFSFTGDGDPMSVILVVFTGLLITFYDFAGKYLVAPGLITLGLIRFFHAAVPGPNLPMVWQPLWLMNHVCIISTVAYYWEDKRPTLTRAHLFFVLGGLGFLDALLLSVVWFRRHRLGMSVAQTFWMEQGLILPIAASVVFFLLGILIKRTSPTPRDAGQRLMLYGLLWLIVYDTAFVAGYVGTDEAFYIFMLLPVAFLAVQFMRWWTRVISLSQRPEFKRAGA